MKSWRRIIKIEEVLFSPTSNCNLACPHCIIPKSKKILSKKTALKFLAGCKRAGIKRVGFTGGEPFLAPDFLFSIVQAAVMKNFLFDRIMTNGVWYKDEAGLKAALLRLYKSGYDGDICVSVDAFHRQDLKKVARFIEIAISIWRRPDLVSIAYVTGSRDAATRKKLKKLSGLLKARLVGFDRGRHPYIKNNSLFIKLYKIDLSPIGKAGRLKNPWGKAWFKEDYCKGPGNIFFVESSGKVKPCCGYASDLDDLTIGDIARDSAGRIIKNFHRNKFVHGIFDTGLSRIRKRLQSAGIKFPGKAANNCYFCHYIMKLKIFFLAIVFSACLIGASGAEDETLKYAKDYSNIGTKIVKVMPLPKGYHEGLFCNNKDVWVVNGKKGDIWVIDKSSGDAKSSIRPIANFTEGITKKSRGEFFVTDWDEKKIYRSKLEGSGLVALSEISVAPAHPAGVVWAGKSLFVIAWTRGLGTKFDLLEMDGAGKIIRKIDIKDIQEPDHLAWDGKYLWIASWYDPFIYKVDIDKMEILSSFHSPVTLTTGIAWDGKHMWVTGTYADLFQMELN